MQRYAPLILALVACTDPSSGDDGTPPTTSSVGTTDATSDDDTSGSSTVPGTSDASTSEVASSTSSASTSTDESSSGDDDPGTTTGVDWVPYFFDDFESYPDGAPVSDFAPYDSAGRTTATTEQAHRGAQSARMAIAPEDGGGFGEWGALLGIDPPVAAGGEVWVRLWMRWPSTFEFSATPYMKFLRLHNRASRGENAGYNDLYVDRADETMSVLRTIKEIHDVWAIYDGPSLPRDTWERYEMYLFVDDVPVDDGGEARVRIWRDDELIFDRTDVPTISDPGGVIDMFLLFTYWNNEMPPENHCYVDDLVIATDANPPPFTDAAGNVWIGHF